MKKVLLITIGGGTGYLLGARAGRPAYDRITRRWADIASAVGLRDIAAAVKVGSIDVREASVSRASASISTFADKAVARVSPGPSTASAPPREEPNHNVVSIGGEIGAY